MADSILQRAEAAARGHEAEHGAGARCLHHGVVDELKRLYAIERDVRALLVCGDEAKEAVGSPGGNRYDHAKQQYVSLGQTATCRLEAGKRLIAAVGRAR